MPGDTVLGLSHTRQQGLRIRDSLALMNKTHEVCSFQNGFSNKNRTGMRVCDAIFNHWRGGRGGGRKDCGDSTVPRDPTGRAYCTEVVVGLDRGLAGMAGEGGDRGGPRTPQPWRCRWSLQYSSHTVHSGAIAAVGENRIGVQDGSHKYYLQIFFEKVSRSPGWPPTRYVDKDDLELLLSPPPKC